MYVLTLMIFICRSNDFNENFHLIRKGVGMGIISLHEFTVHVHNCFKAQR